MDDKISIILPVYNVAIYLDKCMESVINQTYKNIEVLCINDGSTDNSLAVLNKYAANDERIIIIDQENKGVAEARNAAIDRATGKYMMFVDGDDWIERDACQHLMDLMMKHNVDVIMFSYFREYKDRSLTKKDIFDKDFILFDEKECRELHRRHAGIIGRELAHPESADAICSLCTKLFRTDIIKEHQIKYIDNKIIGTYGDGLFNLFYYEYIHSALFTGRYLYHYRKTNVNSIVSTYKGDLPDRWNNMFDIIENYISQKNLGKDFSDGLANRIALSIIGLGLNEMGNKKFSSRYKNIHKIINAKRYRSAIKTLQIKYMPIHWKVFLLCARYRSTFGVCCLLQAIRKLKSKV